MNSKAKIQIEGMQGSKVRPFFFLIIQDGAF